MRTQQQKEVTQRIANLLYAHGFKFRKNFANPVFIRQESGCMFYLDSIAKYESVLDFQLDYPLYSDIDDNSDSPKIPK